jgi:predicted transcriptional regulator
MAAKKTKKMNRKTARKVVRKAPRRERRNVAALSAVQDRILTVLRRAKEPVLSETIPSALELTPQQVETPLARLVADGRAKKTGRCRYSYYTITAKGRKK